MAIEGVRMRRTLVKILMELQILKVEGPKNCCRSIQPPADTRSEYEIQWMHEP
jgi:hypothetical protein